jgi:NAD(P)-dependent dehydrogenase (short-subunit alcohol dehydrogenase family)
VTEPSLLVGRAALVTGGGRGIGRAVALALGRAGARVIVAGRGRAALEAVSRELGGAGRPMPVVEGLDVSDPASVDAFLARLRAAGLHVDILVNNAGIAESAPLSRTDLALWQRHLAVNATGPYLLARALLPAMLERKWGRVISVASTAGLEGAPYITAYAASKHALVGLTRALAAETAGSGVTVNAVCPGFAATDLVWESARRIEAKTGKSFADAVAALAAFNPSGRLIEPDEIAAVVLALAGEDAAGRTGETVVVS